MEHGLEPERNLPKVQWKKDLIRVCQTLYCRKSVSDLTNVCDTGQFKHD